VKINISKIEDVLSELTEEQVSAVTAIIGEPVLVLAGPGSGKTKVIAHRAAWLNKEKGVDPHNIAMLTFGVKAANEMRLRLRDLMGHQLSEDVTVCTIHAFCKRLLVSWGDTRQKAKAWQLKRTIRGVLSKLEKEWIGWKDIQWWIDTAKNNGIAPYRAKEFLLQRLTEEQANLVLACYEATEEVLRQENTFTFPDLLRDVYLDFFESDKSHLDETRKRFKYILIDEFQDCMPLTIHILRAVCDNLYVVGDQNQALYGFVGAQPDIILDDAGFLRFKLTQNFRSTAELVDFSNKLVGAMRYPKVEDFKMTSTRVNNGMMPDGVEIFYPENEWLEAEAVVGICTTHDPKDVMVLARTNAQLGLIETELVHVGTPYVFAGDSGSFFSKAHVLAVTSYLRLAAGVGTDQDIINTVNVGISSNNRHPHRGLGYRFFEELRACGYTPMALLDLDGSDKRLSKYWRSIRGFQAFVSWLTDITLDKAVDAVCQACSEYWLYNEGSPTPDAGADDNILVDFDLIREMATRHGAKTALIEKLTPSTERTEGVILGTIHKMKGSERSIVVCIGWIEGLLPYVVRKNMITEIPVGYPSQIVDERRIAYVAASRAKDELIIMAPQVYRGEPTRASRFIREATK